MWVFFEAFRPWAGRGVIGLARHDARLGFVDPRPLLDVPGLHLAYPTVFIEGDELVCLPDSSCPDGHALFRGTEPGSLRPAGVVPGVPPLRDPTVLEHEGGLVLVGLDIRPRSPILRAFRGDNTRAVDRGRRPHRRRRRHRAPGRELRAAADGRLVRPAQDSRARYGGGIVLREVHLDGGYREEPLAEVGPDPSWAFPAGVPHHQRHRRGDLPRRLPAPHHVAGGAATPPATLGGRVHEVVGGRDAGVSGGRGG